MTIKGRIYFANVISAAMNVTPGNYTLTIVWKGEKEHMNGTDQFVIKFRSEELMRKWTELIGAQNSACLLEKNSTTNTSSTHLHSLAIIDR